MDIQIDSREKDRAIKKIVEEFDRQGINHYVSKLYVGDYMSLDNPRLIIDRKQNLSEVCGNMCQQHRRFRDELIRAQEAGIQVIILVEDGIKFKTLEDVRNWVNPRRWQYCRKYGISTRGDVDAEIAEFVRHGGAKPPVSGVILEKQMRTMTEKYGVVWEFCSKAQTGRRIIEILSRRVA